MILRNNDNSFQLHRVVLSITHITILYVHRPMINVRKKSNKLT